MMKLGVSACLLGRQVRFDGGHKRDDLVLQLGEVFELVGVCPEIELGLGAPREALRLVRRRGELALVGSRSQRDLGGTMHDWAARKVDQIAGWDLSGFVVKKGSPSCGLERVRVYADNGIPERDGTGLFTAALLERLPLLPIEEEGKLRNPVLREAFLERVHAYRALRDLFGADWTLRALIELHSRLKLLLLAYSPDAYRRLGRLVAHCRELDRAALAETYARGVMEALATPPTQPRHANVLQHMAGYFKRQTSAAERQELAQLIDDYRQGHAPRAAVVALIRHHVLRQEVRYLANQVYLSPYPRQLARG